MTSLCPGQHSRIWTARDGLGDRTAGTTKILWTERPPFIVNLRCFKTIVFVELVELKLPVLLFFGQDDIDWRVARLMLFSCSQFVNVVVSQEKPGRVFEQFQDSFDSLRYCLDPKYNAVLDPAIAFEIQPPSQPIQNV